jgi:hypothetical protein
MKEFFSFIITIPILVFGFLYVFLWIVPLDLIKQRKTRKEPFKTHPLPMQNLIDKVKEENTVKSNDWGGA